MNLIHILYDSGMIEGVGQGLDTVFAILQRERMQPPAFEDINHAFFVARVHGRPLEAFTNRDIYGQLTDRQRRILTLIRQQGEIASSDIVAILKAQGTDAAYRSVMRDLGELIQQGLILASGRSRNTRYRLLDEPALPLNPDA